MKPNKLTDAQVTARIGQALMEECVGTLPCITEGLYVAISVPNCKLTPHASDERAAWKKET